MLHLVSLMAAGAIAVPSPPVPSSIEQQVKRADDAFWAAFNACDRSRMAAALAPDVEFYHDKTGSTTLRDSVINSLMDGPCGTPGLHVRRELVADSVSYDPVPGFGAILTGRHRFYARRDGQPERLDGEARFAIVWQDLKGKPLMRRILSYAHGAALEQPIAQSVDLPLATLRRYVGHYASPMGDIAVTLVGNHLHLKSGGLSADLAPVSATVFRTRGRQLLFEFLETEVQIAEVQVRENEVTVARGTRQAVR
jgi:hypothetical protein